MNKKLFRIIKLFSDEEFVFDIENNIAHFKNRPKRELYIPEIRWKEIGDYYNLSKNQKSWKEKILNLKNPEILTESGKLYLKTNWITSYDIEAFRNDYFSKNPFNYFAMIGDYERGI